MTATAEAPAAQAQPAASPRSLASRALQFLGSMKLAVVLLVLLAALTWLGTLAQVGTSTYDVQREYFESWFVLAELPLSFWGEGLFADADGNAFALKIPLPGAFPVLALLALNLLVGGLARLRWNDRNLGVIVIHVGIVLLLAAGFVKMNFSYSGNMPIYETPADGNRAPDRVYESSRFVSFHDFELVLLEDLGDTIAERVVPESALWPARGEGSVTLRGAGLPFTVQVHHWVDHAVPLPKGPMVKTTMPVIDGVFLREQSWPPGEQPKSEQEIAGCYVTVFPERGERIESLLWGMPLLPFQKQRYPFTFTVDGRRFGLDLRHVVTDLPFTMRLDRFQKTDHPGTVSPRDFRSFVSVLEGGKTQEAQIFMNNPLRRDGYVVYQSSYGPKDAKGPPWYSGFEVSYNPSDIWPMLACFVIAAGLLVHFVTKLVHFLQSSTRAALRS